MKTARSSRTVMYAHAGIQNARVSKRKFHESKCQRVFLLTIYLVGELNAFSVIRAIVLGEFEVVIDTLKKTSLRTNSTANHLFHKYE
ncbi:MAG: hypothetical protein LUQ26_15015 [Methylococcaceae bacterium]|nr:hypothetical protein [Methylococcaceae bacterium]